MKLINSKVEILEPTGYTIDDIYKQIYKIDISKIKKLKF